VTLNCTERGYMLIRIRDELQITIDGYKKVYESALAHEIRKSLQASIIRTQLKQILYQVDLMSKYNIMIL